MKFIIIAIFVFSTSNYFNAQVAKIKVEMTYLKTVVNSSEQNKKEYLFRRPSIVKADSKSNYYIVDSRGTEIRKYSKAGTYIKTIGRVGKGPGEYQEIAYLDLDENDNIVIWDSMNLRMTMLSEDGRVLATQNQTKNAIGIFGLWNYYTNNYLLLKYNNEEGTDNMFSLVNKELSKTITSFGYPTIIFNTKDETYMNQRSKINLLVLNNGEVFVANQYYDGKLYKFDPKKRWQHNIYGRKDVSYKTYSIVTSKKPEKDNYNNVINFTNNKTGMQVKILLRTLSAGMVLYRNKYIVNFVVQCNNDPDGHGELGVEIFKKDGEYVGYYKISGENILLKGISTKVFCLDKDNCIYMSDRELNTGVPVIKKYKLAISDK